MSKSVRCPSCGFNSHPVVLIKGSLWRYSCERCRCLFVYDVDNERYE